jgi:pantoate--beta-alanine ligase
VITLDRLRQLRETLAGWRQDGQSIAFVPTMGNLHEGHLSLVRQARKRADRVVVSLFVNPMQFGANEDFDGYPRTEDEDRRLLQEVGADLLFAPEVAEVYPHGQDAHTQISVPVVSEGLCGASRPGHFVGVATVVCKLLNMVQPERALFGEKDYQQLLVIRRMVEDLALPVVIEGVATVREADGLAMSSRNRYLKPDERVRAAQLYRILTQVVDALAQGVHDYPLLEQQAVQRLADAGFDPDYVSIRRDADLARPAAADRPLRVLAAARLGGARLIDNLKID